MTYSHTKHIVDIANGLSQSRVNKDSIVKLLKQAECALSKLGQSETLKSEIEPLSNVLVLHNLLHHKDKDVRLLVAVCFCEIIRVLAPNPPYSDETLKGIFKLFLSMFDELSDIASPYFTRRMKILETFAALKCCVLMLDICEDLVLEMFNIFFSIVREDQQSLFRSMVLVMTTILEEKVSLPLLDVILRNLLKKKKHASSSAFKLSVSILQNCAEKIEPLVQRFLISSISDRDGMGGELKELYHDIIFEIFVCAPQMLLSVIPNLTQELLTDQIDVRIKAINLLGRLFSVPGQHVANQYRQLFLEFLKRFSDKSVEVRFNAVECARTCYLANPCGNEATEVLTALEGRLLDFDDRVRKRAVDVVCDLALAYPRNIPSDIILQTMERLRDKKVSVRRSTMQKLLELYRSYCTKCSEGLLLHVEHFDQIPCKVLALCYDRDCKDFRPQNMEIVLAEDMFPATLTDEEKARHWISSFSFFTSAHIKALSSILSQKRRLQMEMQVYLNLREKEKENDSEEVKKRIMSSFRRMSASFADPSKAEECFQSLHHMKDNAIFKAFLQLLDEGTTLTAQAVRASFLKRIGEKHPHYEFLKLLSTKCSNSIFNAKHVEIILSDVLSKLNGRKSFQTTSIDLLLTIVNIFPSLLRGSEEQLSKLFFLEGYQSNEKLLRMIADVGSHISLKLSDIYPSLELACMEGSRALAKYSVAAVVASAGASNHSVLSDLYNKLVDSLLSGLNIPTVLQSLGHLAQFSISIYESREEEVTQFITNKLFHAGSITSGDEITCENYYNLKIYGLKTLVKSFLPHETAQSKRQISRLLSILFELINEGCSSDDVSMSECANARVRLVALKSILRLAKRWDSHISPLIFHSLMLKARDPSALVRQSFLEKIHKLLREHAIPCRYACAFALASSDCFGDSTKYLAEFIKDYNQEARIRQNHEFHLSGEMMTSCPEYIVVFLIHVLAHHPEFPSENCQDQDSYARFCSPLLVFLEAIVTPIPADGNNIDVDEAALLLLSIFCAIRKAEDAVNSCATPKLHALSDIGALIISNLTHGRISSPSTSGLVLLPSSFYKASNGTKNEKESSCILTRCTFDRSFIERVHFMLKSQSAQPTNTKGRKLLEDSLHLDERYNTRELPSKKQAALLSSKTKSDYPAVAVEIKKTTRQSSLSKMKSAFSSEEFQPGSTASEGANNSPQIAESDFTRDPFLSSCGSVVTKPSLSDAQTSNDQVELVDQMSFDDDMRSLNSKNSATNTKISEGNHKIYLNETKGSSKFHFKDCGLNELFSISDDEDAHQLISIERCRNHHGEIVSDTTKEGEGSEAAVPKKRKIPESKVTDKSVAEVVRRSRRLKVLSDISAV